MTDPRTRSEIEKWLLGILPEPQAQDADAAITFVSNPIFFLTREDARFLLACGVSAFGQDDFWLAGANPGREIRRGDLEQRD